MTNEAADPAPETVAPPEAAPAAAPSAPAVSTPVRAPERPGREPERGGRSDSGDRSERGGRSDSGDRSERGGRSDSGDRHDRGGPRRFARRRGCYFCIEKRDFVDYKDIELLRRYVGERGKMEPRRKVGNCAKHQRIVSQAVKRARYMALLPYTAEHIRITGVFGGRR